MDALITQGCQYIYIIFRDAREKCIRMTLIPPVASSSCKVLGRSFGCGWVEDLRWLESPWRQQQTPCATLGRLGQEASGSDSTAVIKGCLPIASFWIPWLLG